MAIALVYGSAMANLFAGAVSYETDVIKMALHDSTYAPNQDIDANWGDVIGEVAGTGYTAGGVELTGKTVSYDGASNTLILGCDNPQWVGATLTDVCFGVVYKEGASPATSPLLCYVNFGTPQAVSGSSFTVVVPVTGLIQGTVSA